MHSITLTLERDLRNSNPGNKCTRKITSRLTAAKEIVADEKEKMFTAISSLEHLNI